MSNQIQQKGYKKNIIEHDKNICKINKYIDWILRAKNVFFLNDPIIVWLLKIYFKNFVLVHT